MKRIFLCFFFYGFSINSVVNPFMYERYFNVDKFLDNVLTRIPLNDFEFETFLTEFTDIFIGLHNKMREYYFLNKVLCKYLKSDDLLVLDQLEELISMLYKNFKLKIPENFKKKFLIQNNVRKKKFIQNLIGKYEYN